MYGTNRAGVGKLIASVLLATAVVSAPADGRAQSSDDGDWSVSIAPYLFLPVSTTGTTTVADVGADLDLDLADVLGALRFSASARTEVWHDDFGVIIDGYYVNLNATGRATLHGPLAGSASVDVTLKQAWVAAFGAYRFYESSPEAGGALQPIVLDAGAGFRYNNLRQEVKAGIDLSPAVGVQTILGGTEVWFEPSFLLRSSAGIAPDWSVSASAELGGFGVAGSDYQYSVLLSADYAPWEDVSLKLGWQFYGIDFSTNRADGRFGYDVFQTGPYMSGAFRF